MVCLGAKSSNQTVYFMGTRPRRYYCNAFTVNWKKWRKVHTFPPFSLIQQSLSTGNGPSHGPCLHPDWPTAVWFPQMLKLLLQQPVRIPQGKRTLQLRYSGAIHPLPRRLQLLAVRLLVEPFKHEEFLAKQEPLSARRGETQPRDSTQRILHAGSCFVLERTVIPFTQP